MPKRSTNTGFHGANNFFHRTIQYYYLLSLSAKAFLPASITSMILSTS